MSCDAGWWRALALALSAPMVPVAGQCATYQVILAFNQPGASVTGPLAADPAGNLYAVNQASGGELFQIFRFSGSPTSWAAQMLFSYAKVYPNGSEPNGVTLIQSAALGTTADGGTAGLTNGTVYRINTTGGFSNLHVFGGLNTSPEDAALPRAPLVAGPGGLFYGTTSSNRPGEQTLFQISSSSADPSYQILHSFGSSGDGSVPSSGALAVGSDGTLYGVTAHGGANSDSNGTVYAIKYSAGVWQYRLLHSFSTVNGDFQTPNANVVLDSQGNLYGCATHAPHGRGGIFRLTAPAQPSGIWTETMLYVFGSQPNDPSAEQPAGGDCGIAIDQTTGRIIGTTYAGGQYNFGTIFEVDPPASGQTDWTETVLHSFTGSAPDGQYPLAAPIKVGASYYGGTTEGTVYAVTP